MTSVTILSETYSDDGSAARDMRYGGFRQWLLPMISAAMTVCSTVASDTASAAASAAAAASSAATLTGAYAGSITIGTGPKSFTTNTGKQFAAGTFILVYQTSTPTNWMAGQVTAYNSGTGAITIEVVATNGSGALSGWTLAVSGARGATGATGPNYAQARSAKTAGYTAVAGDQGNLIDFTTGGVTLAFTAAATLGAAWWAELRNSSTDDVLLDPNGSETIDGLTSFYMYPGEVRRVFCNGTGFVSLVLNPFYKAFTASGTFTKPPGYNLFGGLAWAGGGGGAVGAASPGGGGGACAPFTLPASVFGATETITIGAASSGSTTATPTAGNATTLGSLVRANGAAASTSANGGAAYQAANLAFSGIAQLTSGPSGPSMFGGGDGAQSSSGYGTVYGGAAGAKQGSTAIPTTFGGAGGAAGTTGVGSPGTAPGGGGGATSSGANGGGGARGELRIWGML